MILADDFYTVTELQEDGNSIRGAIQLNAAHDIFEGHFPGQPVVPGVCMMQMVKELLEVQLQCSLRLAEGHDLKFLSVIDPRKHDTIQVELSYVPLPGAGLSATARFYFAELTFFKFKGVFREL